MPLKLIAPQKRRNKFWYIRGRINGREVEVSTGATDKAAAERFKAAYEHDQLNQPNNRGDAPMSFAAAAESYLAFRNPAAYDRRALQRAVAIIGNKLIGEVNQADLVDVASTIYPNAANATKNRFVLRPISAVLHYAEQNQWRGAVTLSAWREPRRQARPVSKNDAAKFMQALQDEKQQADLKQLYTLWLLRHGNRPSEVREICGAQIDLVKNMFTLHMGKTDRSAVFPLDKQVKLFLQKIWPVGLPSGRLFPWGKRNLHRWFARVARVAGVRFTPHMARHAVGTALKDAGAPIKVIMDKLGHRSYQSSLIYQDSNLETVRAYSDQIAHKLSHNLPTAHKRPKAGKNAGKTKNKLRGGQQNA